MSGGLSVLTYPQLSNSRVPLHPPQTMAIPPSFQDYVSARLFPVTPRPLYSQPAGRPFFTQRDLDLVLYGYAPDCFLYGPCPVRHALSGVFSSTGLGHMSPPTHRHLQTVTATTQEESFPSTLDLPRGLGIFHSSAMNHKGVFCTETVIAKGTKFGPFKGRVVQTSEVKALDDNSHMWEVFTSDGKLSHFVDGKGSTGSWMTYVNCARYPNEQNLIVHQSEQEIYYEACKDIPAGTELLVWYGDAYQQFIGIPLTMKEDAVAKTSENVKNVEGMDGYQCDRCGKMFAYAYYRDKHLKYTRCVDQGDRKYKCHLCDRSFEKRDRLRIHILHVHEKHRPHKCTVCDKSFSQSSSLNKHMRVHSGERPYKCVYCSKAFTASSILRTHIRQHSGEKPFKCKHCGKAFASHAAHDSHVRRTHNKDEFLDREMTHHMGMISPHSPSVKSEGSTSGYSDSISEYAEEHIDVVA